ncbi:hypothetical protein TNCV_4076881 [Trichonephila clavipes]|nr:hypothetical protein TNCV_4076881 [Trichonephila clavipes]
MQLKCGTDISLSLPSQVSDKTKIFEFHITESCKPIACAIIRVPKQVFVRGEIPFSYRSLLSSEPPSSARVLASRGQKAYPSAQGWWFCISGYILPVGGKRFFEIKGCGGGPRWATHQPPYLAAAGCMWDGRFLKKKPTTAAKSDVTIGILNHWIQYRRNQCQVCATTSRQLAEPQHWF